MITANLSKYLFENNYVDGIIYPSVAESNITLGYAGANLALRPEFVDKKAIPQRIVVFEVLDFIDSGWEVKHIKSIDI